MGCVARCIRRNGIDSTNDVIASRVTAFIQDQLEWAKIGITPEYHEELVTTVWGDLFHVLNCNLEILPYFITCAAEQRFAIFLLIMPSFDP